MAFEPSHSPEPTYTIQELAERTGRSYWFWDAECRAGRIEYLQVVPGGTRYVTASQYDAWFLRTLGRRPEEEAAAAEAIAQPVSAGEWVDFEA